MEIILVGLSHKTAPVEIREKVSFQGDRLKEGMLRLKSTDEIMECIILSTCNRVEIYATAGRAEVGIARVKEFLHSNQSDMSLEWFEQHLYIHKNDKAVRHLFRVASSLDSMVIGEPQILGQVKESFDIALLNKTTGVVLNKLFKKALSVAKRVRTETSIGEHAVSISYAAVELARKIFSDLRTRTGLLLGAGEMGTLAARYLVNSGIKEIVVSTRNYERALQLARSYNGRVVPFEDFLDELVKVDVMICSTGAPDYVVKFPQMKDIMHRRKNRPLFIIDISVPRNVDPDINRLDNVFLYDIDDLQSVVETNLRNRQEEAKKGEAIIDEEVDVFIRWFKSLDIVPVIVALREKMEDIRKRELEKTLSKLKDLSPQEKQVIDALTASIVKKILHSPMVTLKNSAQSSNGIMYVEAAKKLFDLDTEENI